MASKSAETKSPVLLAGLVGVERVICHKVTLWVSLMERSYLNVHALIDVLDWIELVLPVESPQEDSAGVLNVRK